MNRKQFLNKTFAAGLGIAVSPLLLQCATPMGSTTIYPLLSLKSGDI